jgi:hypothetical protein
VLFARGELAKAEQKLARGFAAAHPAWAEHRRAWEEARDRRGLEQPIIHRDFHRFPIFQLPAEACAAAAVAAIPPGGERIGELTWTIRPDAEAIAGWPWRGWSWSFAATMNATHPLRALRFLGTWELGGTPVGATLVGLRYRGLGGIEQTVAADADGAVAASWSTTEVLPGAVGSAPVISPAPPAGASITERGYGLRHRVGAWITRPARGGGAPLVDFQCRPHAAFISTFDRQGDLRALSECLPGDRVLSQTDEELFPLTASHSSIPQLHLALVDRERPFTIDELRTRWQEVDAEVRRRVAEELGFVEFPVLPGVGVIASGQPQNLLASMDEALLDAWRDQGVRLIASHSPGWVNEEIYRHGAFLPQHVNGGECSIHDWVPSPPVAPRWRAFQERCAARGIAYLPWLGMTIIDGGPFATRVGSEPHHWSLNTPTDRHGPGYEPKHVKGNRRDPGFAIEYDHCIEQTFAAAGFQGFWIDSFQNLFMSQLAWSDGSGAPLQRAWWEWLAAWSRRGVATMAESHAVPGLSCSIEVAGWEQDLWYFRQVWKWHRGDSMKGYTPEQLEDQCFRALAVGGWVAPGQAYGAQADLGIPRFGEFAHLYLKALPDLCRGYALPSGAGMLWLPATGEGEGIVFTFADLPLPADASAAGLVDGVAVKTLVRRGGYRVQATDLCAAFGVRRPPLADARCGRPRTIPVPVWPVKGSP